MSATTTNASALEPAELGNWETQISEIEDYVAGLNPHSKKSKDRAAVNAYLQNEAFKQFLIERLVALIILNEKFERLLEELKAEAQQRSVKVSNTLDRDEVIKAYDLASKPILALMKDLHEQVKKIVEIIKKYETLLNANASKKKELQATQASLLQQIQVQQQLIATAQLQQAPAAQPVQQQAAQQSISDDSAVMSDETVVGDRIDIAVISTEYNLQTSQLRPVPQVNPVQALAHLAWLMGQLNNVNWHLDNINHFNKTYRMELPKLYEQKEMIIDQIGRLHKVFVQLAEGYMSVSPIVDVMYYQESYRQKARQTPLNTRLDRTSGRKSYEEDDYQQSASFNYKK